MMTANPFKKEQSDVIRWIETKDTGNPRARVYNKIADRTAAVEEIELTDFDMTDPDQSAIWNTTQMRI